MSPSPISFFDDPQSMAAPAPHQINSLIRTPTWLPELKRIEERTAAAEMYIESTGKKPERLRLAKGAAMFARPRLSAEDLRKRAIVSEDHADLHPDDQRAIDDMLAGLELDFPLAEQRVAARRAYVEFKPTGWARRRREAARAAGLAATPVTPPRTLVQWVKRPDFGEEFIARLAASIRDEEIEELRRIAHLQRQRASRRAVRPIPSLAQRLKLFRMKKLGCRPYFEEEVNQLGHVQIVHRGWVPVPRPQARGAPFRFTLVEQEGDARNKSESVEIVVVPKSWWKRKLKRKALRMPRHPLSPDQLKERRTAKQLGLRVKEFRALPPRAVEWSLRLKEGLRMLPQAAIAAASSLGDRFLDYVSFFAATRKQREFLFFAGPTNSGKTFQALSELGSAKTGIYLAPLRLLALEGQQDLMGRGVRCSLVTGEERDIVAGATHIASTIEMLNEYRAYDVAVVDEIQMLCDFRRGAAWTRALFGVLAPRVILTGDPVVEPLVRKLVAEANGKLDVVHLKRKSPLTVLDTPLSSLAHIPPRSAVVAFSRRKVLELRNKLIAAGRTVAVVYGGLGPVVRREEARRFRDGAAEILIATDAIGMGLNLPIAHLYFSEIHKYDRKTDHPISAWELRQIAGRAGRFGKSEHGFVAGVDFVSHQHVTKCMHESPDEGAFRVAMAGPTAEHVETIARLTGISLIRPILKLFSRQVKFSSTTLVMSSLDDILANAWEVDHHAPHVPIAEKWPLACAPVPVGRKFDGERRCFQAILCAMNARKPIGVADACRFVSGGDRGELFHLQRLVGELTIYIWVAFRFPEALPEREIAEQERLAVNQRIVAMLSDKRTIEMESSFARWGFSPDGTGTRGGQRLARGSKQRPSPVVIAAAPVLDDRKPTVHSSASLC
jgi:hypothetical protein